MASLLNISSTGSSIADIIASVRDVPTWTVPYAAATALTRTAEYAAKKAIPAEMRVVFDNPVSYTLNALRFEKASKDNLSARVLVKNAAGSGVTPENFLLPSVDGSGRKKKSSERSLGYQGVLGSAMYAMPGKGMELDGNDNVKGADVRTILTALKSIRAVSNGVDKKTNKRLSKGRKLANDLMVGKPNGGDRPDGIWRREGKRLRPLFVFTDNAPDYSKRLDFSGVVQQVALDRFRPEFDKALKALIARGGRA